MKKILSLGLAATMAMAALPTAFAAETQDYTLGSQVSVIGNAASEYEIKVPARLEAGGAVGNVVATGTWRSSETLIVSAADEVEVTNEETGAKTMVPVVFDGINAPGNDLAAMSISKAVSVEKGDILFGTWTGVIEYNVEFDDGSFQLKIVRNQSGATQTSTITAKPNMTWAAWIASDYHDTSNSSFYYYISDDNTVMKKNNPQDLTLYNGENAVLATDIILESGSYTLQ